MNTTTMNLRDLAECLGGTVSDLHNFAPDIITTEMVLMGHDAMLPEGDVMTVAMAWDMAAEAMIY